MVAVAQPADALQHLVVSGRRAQPGHRRHHQHGYNDPRLAFLYFGFARTCPCCGGRFRRFLEHGFGERRDNARCPRCWALERHRFAWVFLQRRTALLRSPHRVLHMAPEATLRDLLQGVPGIDYVTADIVPGRARLQLDLTRSTEPDASYDLILCNHVLEHIPDDAAAMRELLRMLRPGGLALVTTPWRPDQPTEEDFGPMAPEERTRRFGQPDHVRYYGADLPGRLATAGFEVELVGVPDVLSPREQERWGVDDDPSTQVFACRRPL